MISKRISGRKDGKSSASASLRYGAGLNIDRTTGIYIDKALRIRLGGFWLIENGIYVGQPIESISDLIGLAALEMQSNCDMNTRVGADKKIAHFIFSFGQYEPTEAVLRDVEDSTLAILKLEGNHFATFLHCDSRQIHLHIFASRVSSQFPHNGNSLWRDRTLRDHVCREVEIRHGLKRDHGLHQIDDSGVIVEVPIKQRQENRDKKREISGSASHTEIITGAKSFQTWCNDIRIGDRLQHALSWHDVHSIAAAYSCEVKKKGAGYVISPLGEKGGMQLSKVGLKNLAAKYGPFEPANLDVVNTVNAEYKPVPTKPAAALYDKWKQARVEHGKLKRESVSVLRDAASRSRRELLEQQKSELAKIRDMVVVAARSRAISIKKMEHASALTELAAEIRAQRSTLYKQLAAIAPGTNFRDYLQQQAQAGDDAALKFSRKYGIDEATDVFRKAEIVKLKIVAAISGVANKPVVRSSIKHHIERNGTIIFDLGRGRIVSDSAISKQIQLNAAAANDVESIETSLRFAASRFGKILSLSGSAEFQRLAVETAVRKKLNVKFSDPALEEYRKTFEVFVFHKEIHHVHHARANPTRYIAPTNPRDCMQPLPTCAMAADTKGFEVLLPADVSDRVGKPLTTEWGHPELRRTTVNGRRDEDISASNADLSNADKAVESETATAPDPVDRVTEAVNHGDHHARRRRGKAISNKPKGR